MRSTKFTWDDQKAAANIAKHGIAFQEAATVFADPLSITRPDDMHSEDEKRFVIIGLSNRPRIIAGRSRRTRRIDPHHQCASTDAKGAKRV